jgi:hypothetical protein
LATSVKEPISLTLSAEFYQAIGVIATEWAKLEFWLDGTIWMLAAIDSLDAAACLTAQIPNSGRKFDAIIALAAQRACPESLLKELRSLSGKSDNLQRRRNRIVHDSWMAEQTTGTHYRLEISAAKTLVF